MTGQDTPAPVFLPAHAAALLAYVSSVDERFQTADRESAAARERAWQTILRDVDPGFALQHARRYYSKAGQPRMTPAEVRTAWAGHLRRQDSRERAPLPPAVDPPAGLREYLRLAIRAAAEGRDPASIPVPANARITREADVASRKCREWRNCACDHTACRDGWLDREERIVNGLGKSYPAVSPCPHCKDAALMAAELAAPVRSGGRGRR